ncbi:hypothetical protein L596_018398 [Steinernema carpocapsae]|nr:hypothetical protein L596_018398 [Steinernema carpocapsae]
MWNLWSPPEVKPAHEVFGCSSIQSGASARYRPMGMPTTNLCSLPPSPRKLLLEEPRDFINFFQKTETKATDSRRMDDSVREVSKVSKREEKPKEVKHLRTKLRSEVKKLGQKHCVVCERRLSKEAYACLLCGHRAHITCYEEIRLNRLQCGVCSQRKQKLDESKPGLWKDLKAICCL